MQVLYNGEYREFDPSGDPQYTNIQNGIIARQKYLGLQVGDFKIVVADYDWGIHAPVNHVKCVNCGYEKDIPDLGAFRRGRGAARFCDCGKPKREEKPRVKKVDVKVGETYGNFRVVKFEHKRGYRVECLTCGKQKWESRRSIVEGTVYCNHLITNDYSDPKYIGKRVGSLTSIRRERDKMLFLCDCGTEVWLRPGDVFRQGAVTSCGRYDCEYRRKNLTDSNKTRKKGLTFEFECADEIAQQGFEVEMTPSSGDYGVDFFGVIDGERVAFQCKRLKTESVVHAVQEVYAGGRYYDCCKFVVVSPSGFSYPAELMAQKLGVQLERSLESFKLKSLAENKIPTQKIQTFSGTKLVWEIDGVSKPVQEWCEEHGISRSAVIRRIKMGMSIKEALSAPKYGSKLDIEIDGVKKSKQEWCDEYGISPQLYDYRIKYSGLTPIEALTKPKTR